MSWWEFRGFWGILQRSQDGREGIDGFRRPLHFASSSYLIGKDGAELETWDRGVCLRTEGGVQLKTV